jgi:hypothetical protein
MDENNLREMIRSQINKVIKEVEAKKSVSAKIDKVAQTNATKQLKNALKQGSPDQQAAGLLKIIKTVAADNNLVKNKLRKMLMPKTGKKQKSENKQLDKKMDILSGRQAYKNMLRVLKNKNANQQTDFVADLVNNLDVKGQLSTLFKKIRDKRKSK